ncbi:MAG: hypothetical protein ACYTGQ_02245 [Planctomycetota bacterium]|jgi:hypothetical protein
MNPTAQSILESLQAADPNAIVTDPATMTTASEAVVSPFPMLGVIAFMALIPTAITISLLFGMRGARTVNANIGPARVATVTAATWGVWTLALGGLVM